MDSPPRIYLTSTIPYVNAAPHIGFALELVIVDCIARYHRQCAENVRFLTGTDDNSLKNARAAESIGVPTASFVAHNAARFAELKRVLNISYDDFISTSVDPRHAPAVYKLWNACAANGDIYQAAYEGLYCVGCEQFYSPAELIEGCCAEHGTQPELVVEENYFFRLSRYRQRLLDLIQTQRLSIVPAHRRGEVIGFLQGGLRDLSISRSRERARGWGIPVPGDPSQIVYVWFDALLNYISALDYSQPASELFDRYWTNAARVSHVVGKGVIRFHAVYWPAMLLSAGLRLPDEIQVHGYVTVDGVKISKSLGNVIEPAEAAARFGIDALRYFLLRHIGTHHDGDFSWSRLTQVYEKELADGLGNLASRSAAMLDKYCDGRPPPKSSADPIGIEALASEVDRQVREFALHRALEAIVRRIDAANAYVNQREPWKSFRDGDAVNLRETLGQLHAALVAIGRSLGPFLPETSERLARVFEGGCVRSIDALFPKPLKRNACGP